MLDCFAGSGTTAIASIKQNRKAILMEIDPEWCRSATSKIMSESLFKKGETK